jgi:hypothetical protein
MLVACVLPAVAATQMPFGSFLTRPVSDINDLAQLIREDRVTAQRFADFYGIGNDALANYIEKYGEEYTVPRSTSYLEYFIDGGGRVRKHHKIVRAGSKVLMIKGMAVMDLQCGNPMVRPLPTIVEKVEPIVQETPAPEQPAVVLEPEVFQEPPPPPAPEPVVQVLPQIPVEYPTVAVALSITELAYLLPGLLGLGTLGGGGTDTAVPEPTGLMTLGLSGAGFVILCYRRHRSRATKSS